jgi:hypothetical protein
MPLRSLNVSESKVVRHVDPAKLHIETDLSVKGNECYSFQSDGQWLDWFLKCGPDGWGRWNPLKFCNRLAGREFFLLCGNVGKDDRLAFPAFSVQKELGICEWTVPIEVNQLDDQQLYLFANDWPCEWAYKNNKVLSSEEGKPLEVTITRIK